MASKSISINEDKLQQLNELALKLGYETNGRITPEKQLIDDIILGVLESRYFIDDDVKINDQITQSLKNLNALKNRKSGYKKRHLALIRLESLIAKYAEDGLVKSKTYYNKTHRINYDFLSAYESTHPGVFG